MDKDYLLSRINYESYYSKHLDQFKPKNGESYGLCFMHADKKPSLRVNLDKGMWTCPVCNKGGDIFRLHMDKYRVSFKQAMKEIADEQGISQVKPKVVATYNYTDAAGKLLYKKERLEGANGKSFRFNSNGTWSRVGKSMLYNLTRVSKAKCVILVEGEKCADKITELGLCGTTLDSGADSKWLPEFTELLKGKNVVLLPDNDEPGKRYMKKIAEHLPTCKLIELPRLKPKGDIADWDGDKKELLALIKASPLWAPERDYTHVKSIVSQVAHDLAFGDPTTKGVQTGIKAVDDMGGCLRRQDLIIVAARPSMGKTAFVVSIMRNMALAGEPVIMFSLEMGKEQITERLLCQEAKVSHHDITRKIDHELNARKIMSAAQPVHDMPIYFDDTGGISVEKLEERLLIAIKGRGIKCVFIDYLQLMSTDNTRTQNRTQDLGHITRSLKRIAKENSIPVVLLSQLNRKVEERTNRRPLLGDLRDSGEIEQDADLVIFLYRDEYYNPLTTNDLGVAEAIFAKYRNGKTGTVRLAFLDKTMSFVDLEEV